MCTFDTQLSKTLYWSHQTVQSSCSLFGYPTICALLHLISACFHRQNSALSELWLVSVSRCQWIPHWILWPGSRNYKIILWTPLDPPGWAIQSFQPPSSTIFGAFSSTCFLIWPLLLIAHELTLNLDHFTWTNKLYNVDWSYPKDLIRSVLAQIPIQRIRSVHP